MMDLRKINELFDFEKGTLQSSKCTSGRYDFVTASAKWKTHREYAYDKEALIVAVAASGSLGRVHYVNGKFISSDLCFILTPKDKKNIPIDLSFYFYVFKLFREDLVKKTATGTSKMAINQTNFGNYKIPYFDIKHQNKYKYKLVKLAKEKDVLIGNIKDQKIILQKLRQSILQDAIEGKLTAEWRKKNPNVEPASELLKKIKAEKEKLIAEKKIKKEKPLPEISKEEIPFELPKGWEWCRLGNVSNSTSGSTPQRGNPEYWKDGKISWLKSGELNDSIINYYSREKITEVGLKKSSATLFPKGTLLIAMYGATAGRLGLLDIESATNQAVCGFFENKFIVSKYLFHLLFCMRKKIIAESWGQAQPNISQNYLRNFLIPVPPLSEQRAIVKKVETLMQKLDKLEKEISQNQKTADMLMQAVLKEAFEK